MTATTQPLSPGTVAVGGEFDRITHNPAVMAGKACIRGMRVTAGMIVRETKAGTTPARLLELFPYLEQEDIDQAIRYADWIAREHKGLLRSACKSFWI